MLDSYDPCCFMRSYVNKIIPRAVANRPDKALLDFVVGAKRSGRATGSELAGIEQIRVVGQLQSFRTINSKCSMRSLHLDTAARQHEENRDPIQTATKPRLREDNHLLPFFDFLCHRIPHTPLVSKQNLPRSMLKTRKPTASKIPPYR